MHTPERRGRQAGRQAREQFLTVRLNARAAAAQLVTAKCSVRHSGPSEDVDSSFEVDLTALNKAEIAIEIIALEASQGFDGGVWTPSVEKESIRQYIVSIRRRYVAFWDACEQRGDRETTWTSIGTAIAQFKVLGEMFRFKYPDIYMQCEFVKEFLRRDQKDPSPAIGWCRAAENFFAQGQSPWV
jgi:hypothetical protein